MSTQHRRKRVQALILLGAVAAVSIVFVLHRTGLMDSLPHWAYTVLSILGVAALFAVPAVPWALSEIYRHDFRGLVLGILGFAVSLLLLHGLHRKQIDWERVWQHHFTSLVADAIREGHSDTVLSAFDHFTRRCFTDEKFNDERAEMWRRVKEVISTNELSEGHPLSPAP